jgi:hypothetical protein
MKHLNLPKPSRPRHRSPLEGQQAVQSAFLSVLCIAECSIEMLSGGTAMLKDVRSGNE